MSWKLFVLGVVCLAFASCAPDSQLVGERYVFDYNGCKFSSMTVSISGFKSNDDHKLILKCPHDDEEFDKASAFNILEIIELSSSTAYSFELTDEILSVGACPEYQKEDLEEIQDRINFIVAEILRRDLNINLVAMEQLCYG